MGYFIHLLTDKYWFRDYVYQYIERFAKENNKKKLTYTAIRDIIYNDYTNINIDLIDLHGLTLDLFSNEIEYPKSKIKEIPIDKLPVIVEKMGLIIKDSTQEKTFMFDVKDIEIFINKLNIDILTSKIIIIFLVTVIQFTINKKITFRKSNE